MTEQTIDSILDETLDDLADLPESKPFTPGAHVVSLSVVRDQKKPTTFIARFKHIETLELSSPSDDSPKPGSEAVMFIHTAKKDGTANEFGQGQLKQLLKPVSDATGLKKVSDILEALKSGIAVTIVSGIKKSTGYPDSMTLSSVTMM